MARIEAVLGEPSLAVLPDWPLTVAMTSLLALGSNVHPHRTRAVRRREVAMTSLLALGSNGISGSMTDLVKKDSGFGMHVDA